jgi:hypothetical protein
MRSVASSQMCYTILHTARSSSKNTWPAVSCRPAVLAVLSVIVLVALIYVGSRGPLALSAWFPWRAAMKPTLR